MFWYQSVCLAWCANNEMQKVLNVDRKLLTRTICCCIYDAAAGVRLLFDRCNHTDNRSRTKTTPTATMLHNQCCQTMLLRASCVWLNLAAINLHHRQAKRLGFCIVSQSQRHQRFAGWRIFISIAAGHHRAHTHTLIYIARYAHEEFFGQKVKQVVLYIAASSCIHVAVRLIEVRAPFLCIVLPLSGLCSINSCAIN